MQKLGDLTYRKVSQFTGLDSDGAIKAFEMIQNDNDDKLTGQERALLHQFGTYIDNNKLSVRIDTEIQNLNTPRQNHAIHKGNLPKILKYSSLGLVAATAIVCAFVLCGSLFSRGNNLKVYTTPSGSKYHLATCRHVYQRNDLAEWNFDSVPRQYAPCGDCNPDRQIK